MLKLMLKLSAFSLIIQIYVYPLSYSYYQFSFLKFPSSKLNSVSKNIIDSHLHLFLKISIPYFHHFSTFLNYFFPACSHFPSYAMISFISQIFLKALSTSYSSYLWFPIYHLFLSSNDATILYELNSLRFYLFRCEVIEFVDLEVKFFIF